MRPLCLLSSIFNFGLQALQQAELLLHNFGQIFVIVELLLYKETATFVQIKGIQYNEHPLSFENYFFQLVQIFHNDQTSSWSGVFNFHYKMVKVVVISIFITINKRTCLPISQNNFHQNISQSPNYNSSTLSPILNTSTFLVFFAFTKQAKMTTKTTKNLVPNKQVVPLPLLMHNLNINNHSFPHDVLFLQVH